MTAIISTTINIPKVFALYAAMDPEVEIIIAGDLKSPDEAEDWFYENCGPKARLQYMTPDQQRDLGYKSSELTGWNCDSRRNIALLEAVKGGADDIISCDDDMIPLRPGFLTDMEDRLDLPFNGMMLGVPGFWFDAGRYTVPPAAQRGLPADIDCISNNEFVANAKVGLVQGIILGTPDTDAMTAMAGKPRIHGVTDVLRAGFVVDPEALAVVNSQNTGFIRELAPAFAQFYKWHGRNTDIFSSLIMRRLMRDRNLYTYFGPPMSFHARKSRPLFGDLKAEMYGIAHIQELNDGLNRMSFDDVSVLEGCRKVVHDLPSIFTPECAECANAFLDDMESVL